MFFMFQSKMSQSTTQLYQNQATEQLCSTIYGVLTVCLNVLCILYDIRILILNIFHDCYHFHVGPNKKRIFKNQTGFSSILFEERTGFHATQLTIYFCIIFLSSQLSSISFIARPFTKWPFMNKKIQ